MWYTMEMNVQETQPKKLPSFFDTVPLESSERKMPVSPGRPPKLKQQLARAEVLAKQLQAAVRAGLQPLLEQYPDLIEIAIETAKKGDSRMLQFLIALPLKMVQLDEFKGENLGNDIIKDALAGRTVNIQVNNMAPVPRTVDGKVRVQAD